MIQSPPYQGPFRRLFRWLPKVDFVVLGHRFASHGRDYGILIEDRQGSCPGRHEVIFTLCVRADCETRVSDKAWGKSWSDELTDYEKWN